MDKHPIYLDYASTTPLDPRVREVMLAHLGHHGGFANPSATTHAPGRHAASVIETAREHLAALIAADPRELTWTSGATEAINMAVAGAARFYADTGRHIVTTTQEHTATLDVCRALEREGFRVTRVAPDAAGHIQPQDIAAAVADDTVLVSVLHVNNETGVIQDIAGIGAVCREAGVRLHVDAAQSLGKLPLDTGALPVDYVSFSAHKLCGPKGVGALYVRREPRARIRPLMHGGGHERGLRPGTLATHQIAGMGEACRIAAQERDTEQARIAALRDRLWEGLRSCGGVQLNGDTPQRVAGILNVAIDGIAVEALVAGTPELAFSLGSACTSATSEPSHVLRTMGLDDARVRASIRLSPGRFTSEADIEQAVACLRSEIRRLREISPLWPPAGQGDAA